MNLLGRASAPRARAGLTVVTGTGIGAVASFIAAIIAARTLSIDGFAAFGVGMAVNSLTMQFGDLGLSTVAMAEAADAKGPHEARSKLARLGRRRLLSALLSGLLVALVVVLIPALEPYREVALIAAAGGILGCISIFLVGALQAFRRFVPAGGVQAILGGARLTAVIVAALAGMGPAAMMVGYGVIAPVAATAFGLLILLRHRNAELASDESVEPDGPDSRIDVSSVGRSDRTRRRYIAIVAIFSALLLNGDVLLLTMIGNEAEVATYSAAWRIAAGILIINAALASAILPFVLDSSDPWREVGKLTRAGAGVAAIWLLLAVPITFVGVRVLGEVGDDATWPLLILLVAFSFDAFFYVVHLVYFRVRREWFIATMLVSEFAMMVLVTLAFRDQGAMAPALGQIAARVLVCIAVLGPVLLRRSGRTDWFSGTLSAKADGGSSRE